MGRSGQKISTKTHPRGNFALDLIHLVVIHAKKARPQMVELLQGY